MILPDWRLLDWVKNGGLEPFDHQCINPASVDLRWSGRYRRAKSVGFAQDGWSEVCEKLGTEALTIFPGELVLLDTLEIITIPNNCCGMITLKSTIGRLGLEHMHAGFFDPGFHGTGTLEMYNAASWQVKIKPGQRIVQIVLMEMAGTPDTIYHGRYQNDMQPMPQKGV